MQLFTRRNHQQLLVIVTIWALWLSRNKLLHEGKQQTNNDLCIFILGYVRELEALEGMRRWCGGLFQIRGLELISIIDFTEIWRR
ncbi:hypothetical protein ERO13_D07G142750v2 [Gossypium hirsutum]|uniref:Uncharacterized protein n=3 Tax=Gossypium TaxID=3633 RepID=A0A5J5QRV0_GOSBA|nr:hypothetical protein ES319_D07G153500v1 [Gossypium barbadense]KAG4138575.1 hypothetical protein ERO13_D07G142750v2 [Gossypium hirsutum]TYG61614.1 hypothetical protein ES288_D07G163300v1 [Gossypium darwinii]TYH63018.1 hypothetical protein ES332_D07G161300v1 [Gossypium tomentosum]